MADTSKVLIYNNEFGTISIVHPSAKSSKTWDEIKAGISTSRCPDQGFHLVDKNDVPKDRSIRNAWTYSDGNNAGGN